MHPCTCFFLSSFKYTSVESVPCRSLTDPVNHPSPRCSLVRGFFLKDCLHSSCAGLARRPHATLHEFPGSRLQLEIHLFGSTHYDACAHGSFPPRFLREDRC